METLLSKSPNFTNLDFTGFVLSIRSLYGVFACIWLMFMVSVGKYIRHGSYGSFSRLFGVCDVAIIICLYSLFLVFSATDCHSARIIYGCFRKWWYPQNTPKWPFLVGKPMVVGYHHFRKHPYISVTKHKNNQRLHGKRVSSCHNFSNVTVFFGIFWGQKQTCIHLGNL